MNAARPLSRLLSLALAALITSSMLAGIDNLAGRDNAPDALLARTAASQPA